jgi:hypothetical protein
VSTPLAMDYRFRPDSGLGTLEAELCFRERVPAQLTSGLPGAGRALREAWMIEARDRRRELPIRDGRIALAGVHPGACIGYAIDLHAAEAGGAFAVLRRGDALVTNIALWLWRPPDWSEPVDVSASFELPAGVALSVPWRRDGARYRLDASAFAFYAYAALGRFERIAFDVAGATLEVALLPGLTPASRDELEPWLRRAATATAQPFARFPRERAQVVVVPTDARAGTQDAVPFGTVTRGGGASALMLLAANAGRPALLRDWVAVHEFAHLLHPFLSRQDAWLAEGLATYYQEVLRVRAGLHSEADAWRRLYEGASLGRAMRTSVRDESAAMHRNHSYRPVYWAGAAFALLADAELRRATAGRFDLDQALASLASRTAAQARPLSSQALIEALDIAAGTRVLVPLAARWIEGPTWPDLEALLAGFGIAPGAWHAASDAAPEAWIGRAIMGRVTSSRASGR